MRKPLTRRDFLKGSAGAAFLGAAISCKKQAPAPNRTPQAKEAARKQQQHTFSKPAPAGRQTTSRTKVVVIRDKAVQDSTGKVNQEVVSGMLDEALTVLTDVSDPQTAWSGVLQPSDVLGIKSNVWRFLPVPKELEQAIINRAVGAGVPEKRIAVDDRGVLDNDIFKKATALINVRTSRTHHWSGVGSCIKNYIVFHPKPSAWHDDSCANLAGIWDLPIVKGKTRLNILVMLTPLFHGKGPQHFNAEYTWHYNGLILGTDPVAVDSTGVRILQAKRLEHFGTRTPFAVPPKHILVAQEKYKLGIADPDRIDVIKLGWDEDVLI